MSASTLPNTTADEGTIVGSALGRCGTAFTTAEHGAWWLALGLGVAIMVLGVRSTGRWASDTAARAATLFEEVDRARTRAPRPRLRYLNRASPRAHRTQGLNQREARIITSWLAERADQFAGRRISTPVEDPPPGARLQGIDSLLELIAAAEDACQQLIAEHVDYAERVLAEHTRWPQHGAA